MYNLGAVLASPLALFVEYRFTMHSPFSGGRSLDGVKGEPFPRFFACLHVARCLSVVSPTNAGFAPSCRPLCVGILSQRPENLPKCMS